MLCGPADPNLGSYSGKRLLQLKGALPEKVLSGDQRVIKVYGIVSIYLAAS